jgi:hypothetical protein
VGEHLGLTKPEKNGEIIDLNNLRDMFGPVRLEVQKQARRYKICTKFFIPKLGVPAHSAELLGQRDHDPLRAADVTKPILVLVPRQLANEFGAMARKRESTPSMSSTANMRRRMPRVFTGAFFGSALSGVGLWNFVSSSRLCPSGVRIMAMST